MRDLRPSRPLGARTGPLRWSPGLPLLQEGGLLPRGRGRWCRKRPTAFAAGRRLFVALLPRQHAGPSPEPPVGCSRGTATLGHPTAYAAGRRPFATWMQTIATGAPDCLCRREAASRRATRPDGAALVAALMRVVTASALVAYEPAPPCWGRRECCTLLVCVSNTGGSAARFILRRSQW